MLKEGHLVKEVTNKLNFDFRTLWKNAREAYREAGVPYLRNTGLKEE